MPDVFLKTEVAKFSASLREVSNGFPVFLNAEIITHLPVCIKDLINMHIAWDGAAILRA